MEVGALEIAVACLANCLLLTLEDYMEFAVLRSMYTAKVGEHVRPKPVEQNPETPRMTPGFAADKNSCAVRLSDALTRADPSFFVGQDIPRNHRFVASRSAGKYMESDDAVGQKFVTVEKKRVLAANAAGLARILDAKLANGRDVTSNALPTETGIIFYEFGPGQGASGHITLWEDGRPLDWGDWAGECVRIRFWPIR
jgi:hypothetical protein